MLWRLVWQLVRLGEYGQVSDAQQHVLGRIQHAGQHMADIVNDVLQFASVEAGKVEYQRAAVPVRDVVQQAADLLEPQAIAKSISFDMEAIGDSVVVADAHKLEQVLVNLLSNAIKFTRPGGRVEVRAADVVEQSAAGHQWVHIDVADTGVGIAQERLNAIFDPFVQVGSESAMRHGGTGLGLTISREFARGMGGDLTVTSAPGKGSTFRVTLPSAIWR